MNTFRLELASPESAHDLEGVTFLDIPAADGRMTILPGHQSLICALIAGEARVRTTQKEGDQIFSFGSGVMTVTPDAVRIVTRTAPAPLNAA